MAWLSLRVAEPKTGLIELSVVWWGVESEWVLLSFSYLTFILPLSIRR